MIVSFLSLLSSILSACLVALLSPTPTCVCLCVTIATSTGMSPNATTWFVLDLLCPTTHPNRRLTFSRSDTSPSNIVLAQQSIGQNHQQQRQQNPKRWQLLLYPSFRLTSCAEGVKASDDETASSRTATRAVREIIFFLLFDVMGGSVCVCMCELAQVCAVLRVGVCVCVCVFACRNRVGLQQAVMSVPTSRRSVR